MPIFYPVVDALEIDLVWFGAIVAVTLQTAFLSASVAMSAYYLKQVVKGFVRNAPRSLEGRAHGQGRASWSGAPARAALRGPALEPRGHARPRSSRAMARRPV